MNIVHVETGRHLYGGAQQVLWLVRGLAATGVDNLLVCPPGSEVAAAAAGLAIPVCELACAGDHDAGFALRLRRLLKARQPDLVHCHSRRGADIMGGVAARLAGIPAVLSRRVDNPESGLSMRLRYRWFRKVIAISENVASTLRDQGLAGERVELIRSAVDVDRFAADADRPRLAGEFDIGPGHFAIAVVAQLIRRKGHRFLLDVLPGLGEAHPGIRVVFFGQGPEEAVLRRLASRLGVAPIVTFAGYRADLGELLGAFDLLVHPALREGLGVAMLEAAACGLPVVAFDTAGAREAVLHGETGVLVDSGDLAALQRAIGTMIEEPDMRREFGAAGRERMRDEFGVPTMVERHLDLYRRLIDGRH
jgi:glycosyltransferase involved in cell wall biosynthesis